MCCGSDIGFRVHCSGIVRTNGTPAYHAGDGEASRFDHLQIEVDCQRGCEHVESRAEIRARAGNTHMTSIESTVTIFCNYIANTWNGGAPWSHARVYEIGTLYTAVAGMLNLMAILDAAYRAANEGAR